MQPVQKAELDVERLVERLASGDIRALARAVSLVENGAACAGSILGACRALQRRSRRIGVTGPAGAGKSTLVDQMVRHLRGKGERVGVLAVDPTSPFTGGALLGDRIRMQGFGGDDGVFIRSMASRGEAGGVAKAAEDVCILLESAGFQTVLLETLGVGQAEVSVTRLVDTTLLVLVPGTGDDVQSLKAGIMEAADVFVVNKNDRPGAEQLETEILAMQSLTGNQRPVFRTNALSGEGVPDLLSALEQSRSGTGRPRADPELTLDHVGIAVRSIAAVRAFYEGLGSSPGPEEFVEEEQVKAVMVPIGSTRIELLEATAEASVIGRFLARRGEGLHHIALRVDRVDARFREMQAAGIRLASECVRVGAGGHRYFFVHPQGTGGVLVELVGD